MTQLASSRDSRLAKVAERKYFGPLVGDDDVVLCTYVLLIHIEIVDYDKAKDEFTLGLNLMVAVEDTAEVPGAIPSTDLFNLAKPWLWAGIQGISAYDNDAALPVPADLVVQSGEVTEPEELKALKAQLSKCVDELIASDSLKWSPNANEPPQIGRLFVRDVHGQFATKPYPLGNSLNLTRMFRTKLQSKNFIAAPQIKLNEKTSLTPDGVPKVVPDTGGAIWTWDYTPAVSSDKSAKPQTKALIRAYVKSVNLSEARKGDPRADLWLTSEEWLGQNWKANLDDKIAPLFDLAQRLIDWARDSLKLGRPTVPRERLRDAVQLCLMDASGSGCIPPAGQVPMIDSWTERLQQELYGDNPSRDAVDINSPVIFRALAAAFRSECQRFAQDGTRWNLKNWRKLVRASMSDIALLSIASEDPDSTGQTDLSFLSQLETLQTAISDDRRLLPLVWNTWITAVGLSKLNVEAAPVEIKESRHYTTFARVPLDKQGYPKALEVGALTLLRNDNWTILTRFPSPEVDIDWTLISTSGEKPKTILTLTKNQLSAGVDKIVLENDLQWLAISWDREKFQLNVTLRGTAVKVKQLKVPATDFRQVYISSTQKDLRAPLIFTQLDRPMDQGLVDQVVNLWDSQVAVSPILILDTNANTTLGASGAAARLFWNRYASILYRDRIFNSGFSIRRSLSRAVVGPFWPNLQSKLGKQQGTESLPTEAAAQLKTYFSERLAPPPVPKLLPFFPAGMSLGLPDKPLNDMLERVATDFVTNLVIPKTEEKKDDGSVTPVGTGRGETAHPDALVIPIPFNHPNEMQGAQQAGATDDDELRDMAGVGMLLRLKKEAHEIGSSTDEVVSPWCCLNTVSVNLSKDDKSSHQIVSGAIVPYRLVYRNNTRDDLVSYNQWPLIMPEEAGDLSENSAKSGTLTERPVGAIPDISYGLVPSKDALFDPWSGLPMLLYGRTLEYAAFKISNSLALPKGLSTDDNPAAIRMNDEFNAKGPPDKSCQSIKYLRRTSVGPVNTILRKPTTEDQTNDLQSQLPAIPTDTRPLARDLTRYWLAPQWNHDANGYGWPQHQYLWKKKANLNGKSIRLQIDAIDARAMVDPLKVAIDLKRLQQQQPGHVSKSRNLLTILVKRDSNALLTVQIDDGKASLPVPLFDLTVFGLSLQLRFDSAAGQATINGTLSVTSPELQYAFEPAPPREPTPQTDPNELVLLKSLVSKTIGPANVLDDQLSATLAGSVDSKSPGSQVLVYQMPDLNDVTLESASYDPNTKYGIQSISSLRIDDGRDAARDAARDYDPPGSPVTDVSRLPLILLRPKDSQDAWLSGPSDYSFFAYKPEISLNIWMRWNLPSHLLDKPRASRALVWSETLKHRDEGVNTKAGSQKTFVPWVPRDGRGGIVPFRDPDDPAVEDALVVQLIPWHMGAASRANERSTDWMKWVNVAPRRKETAGYDQHIHAGHAEFTINQVNAEDSDDRITVTSNHVTINISDGEVWELVIWAPVRKEWFVGDYQRFQWDPAESGRSYQYDGNDYVLFSPKRYLVEAAYDAFTSDVVILDFQPEQANEPAGTVDLRKSLIDLGYSAANTIHTKATPSVLDRAMVKQAGVVVVQDRSKAEPNRAWIKLLQETRVPVLIWSSNPAWFATNGVLPVDTKVRDITEIVIPGQRASFAGALPLDSKILLKPSVKALTTQVTDNDIVKIEVGAKFEVVHTGDSKTTPVFGALRGSKLNGPLIAGRRLAFTLDPATQWGDGSKPVIEQLLQACLVWLAGPPLGEALWESLQPKTDTGPDGSRVISVHWKRIIHPRFRWIGDVELLRQIWRWNGLPAPAFPSREDLDQVPLLADEAFRESPSPSLCPLLWDAYGFGTREEDDSQRKRIQTHLGDPSTEIFRESASTEQQVRYERFSMIAQSRYKGMLRNSELVAMRRTAGDPSRLAPKAHIDRWRRAVLPYQHPKDLTTGNIVPPALPVVDFILPLTRYVGHYLSDSCAKTQSGLPPLLVILGESFYDKTGLAGELEGEIVWTDGGPVATKVPTPRKISYLQEVGPDPILSDGALKSDEYRVGFLTLNGPVGTTFEPTSNEPYYVKSAFTALPRVFRNNVEELDLGWYFVKVGFRRLLRPELCEKLPSALPQSVEMGWIWDVQLDWPPPSASHKLKLTLCDQSPAGVPAPVVEVKTSADFRTLGVSLLKESSGTVFGFGTQPAGWRLDKVQNKPTLTLRARAIVKTVTSSPNAPKKYIWSVTLQFQSDDRTWTPFAHAHWVTEQELKFAPSMVMGETPIPTLQLVPTVQSATTQGAWIQVLPDSDQFNCRRTKESKEYSVNIRSMLISTTASPTQPFIDFKVCDRDTMEVLNLSPPSLSKYWIAVTEQIVDISGNDERERFIGIYSSSDSSPGEFVVRYPFDSKPKDDGTKSTGSPHPSVQFSDPARLRARILTLQTSPHLGKLRDSSDLAWNDLFVGYGNLFSETNGLSDQPALFPEDEVIRVVAVSSAFGSVYALQQS